LREALERLNERLDRFEERAAETAQTARHANDRTQEAEQRAADERDDLRKLRTSLLRLEHRFQIHAEEAGKTTGALVERIELARIASAKNL